MKTRPTNDLHRLARGTTPWVAYKETEFKGRFDDPGHGYFVLYASSSRLSCFVECLAYFREQPKPGFEQLDAFEPVFPSGVVPPEWFVNRFSQTAQVGGKFADVAHSEWIALLLDLVPVALSQELLAEGFVYPWIDQSAIYQSKSRRLTQWISKTVFDRPEQFSGIRYMSKHGLDFWNWAIFEERASIRPSGPLVPIRLDDADLLEACRKLRVKPPLEMPTEMTTFAFVTS